jgi:hypothetical protein
MDWRESRLLRFIVRPRFGFAGGLRGGSGARDEIQTLI